MDVWTPGASKVRVIVEPTVRVSLEYVVIPDEPDGQPVSVGGLIEVIVATAVLAEAGDTWIWADCWHPAGPSTP